jgi:FtsH-binding integral membrane protein
MEAMHSVSSSSIDARVSFIRKTYAHLMGAILAFVGLEVALFQTGLAEIVASAMLSVSWLLVLGLFMGVAWAADWLAHRETSKAVQYVGLGLYVVAEAFLMTPLLYMAVAYSDPSVLPSAVVTTLVVFAGLTVAVFVTKKDFSFLRTALVVASFGAFGLIIAATLFGFQLGMLFSVAMAVVAAGFVLYSTSNVLLHYDTHQYVAASLALFSSVALMFWYILRIFMGRD